MKTWRFLAVVFALISTQVFAEEASLEVRVKGMSSTGNMAQKFAYCIPDEITHTRDGSNINPEISWSKGPEGTKSYALIIHDLKFPWCLMMQIKMRKQSLKLLRA